MATQAGSDFDAGAPEALGIERNKDFFGPLGPLLKALGVGFALGALTTAAALLFAG